MASKQNMACIAQYLIVKVLSTNAMDVIKSIIASQIY